jgi:hypothetical protein
MCNKCSVEADMTSKAIEVFDDSGYWMKKIIECSGITNGQPNK